LDNYLSNDLTIKSASWIIYQILW